MKTLLTAIALVGLCVVIVLYWAFFMFLVLGFVGLAVAWLLLTQLSGAKLNVTVKQPDGSSKLVGYLKYFKYHRL